MNKIKKKLSIVLIITLIIGTMSEITFHYTAMAANGVKEVSLGARHSAAIMENGDLYCWGWNEYGQLGDGTTTERDIPVKIMSNVRDVSLGGNHSAAITENGDLYCWGWNGTGQIGDGTTTERVIPVKIMSNVRDVSLGSNHSAAITENGDLYCWGINDKDQIGNGSYDYSIHSPVKIMSNVKKVSLGTSESAAITESGDLYCWGTTPSGAIIGNIPGINEVYKSVPFFKMSNVKEISLKSWNNVAITENGDLHSWGSRIHGAIGDGKGEWVSGNVINEPVKIMSNVKAVSLGSYSGAAITENGDLYCWGSNEYGQLGDSTTTDRYAPVKITSNMKAVSLGGGHSAAITENGDLYCWGWNQHGQIGDGTTDDRYIPIKISIGDDNEETVNEAYKFERASTKNTTGYLYQDKGKFTGYIPINCPENELSNASSTYNHRLATFAASMATMMYSTNDSIDNVLKGLGYSVPNNRNHIADTKEGVGKENPEKVGKVSPYTIAYKTVNLNDVATDIITVSVRGTYQEEWVDNFDSGYGFSTHKGFERAANFVYDGICSFCKEHNLGKRQIKILVTGHSRGAACANLLGTKLNNNGINGNGTSINVPKDNIFVYTFATPNTTSLSERNTSSFNNIYNIVNPEDFVTKVLPSGWGYGRYGITYILPSKSTDNLFSYNSYLSNIKKLYKDYRREDSDGYNPYTLGMLDVSAYVKSVTTAVSSEKKYYTKNLHNFLDFGNVNEPLSLQKLYTYTLGYFMSKNKNYTNASYAFMLSALKGDYGLLGTETMAFFVAHQAIGAAPVLTGSFECAHRPETYLAAMNTLSKEELTKKRKTLLGIVNCPVDIEITDENNNIVGKIENNNVIDENSDISMAVEGDSKTFMIPEEGNYNVNLTGNNDGTLDYSLCEMDVDTGEVGRVFYDDLKLKKGTRYTQSLTEGVELADTVLKDSSNNTVESDKVLNEDELGKLSVEVNIEGIGEAPSKYNLSCGDYVSIEAKTDENNEFLGWYDKNDNIISKDSKLAFSISKNEEYKAKFTNNIVDATGITFDKSSITMNVGDYVYNEATILPSNATYKYTHFSSSNENVVTVDDLGGITALTEGKAVITATSEDGNAKASYVVNVEDENTTTIANEKTSTTNIVATADSKINQNTPDNKYTTTITVKKTAIKKVQTKKKALKVSWKKVKGVSGYKLQYSTKKNFKKAKTIKVKKSKNTSKIIKKLKSKKKYYIRICTYKIVRKKVYCSKWSKAKKKMTK